MLALAVVMLGIALLPSISRKREAIFVDDE
jgi:hypothetical protein